MKLNVVPGYVLCSFVAALAVVLIGCETTEHAPLIEITPDSADVSGARATVVFAVVTNDASSPLFLPLEWRVDRPELGRVSASGSLTAVYESTGAVGNNAITVRDQGEAKGVAVVNQR